MWGAPPDVKKRARTAALINLFTGVGGFFWAGHWILGLVYTGILIFSFFSIFLGIGFILFPLMWIWSVAHGYVTVVQAATSKALWNTAQSVEDQQLNQDGDGASS